MHLKRFVLPVVFILAALMIVVPADAIILNPGQSIQTAINNGYSVILLNPGTYYDTGVIVVNGDGKTVTIEANAAAGGNQTNTLLEGGGTIFEINGALNAVNIDNLTFNGEVLVNGNVNDITITSSTFDHTGEPAIVNVGNNDINIQSSMFSFNGGDAIFYNGVGSITILFSTFTGIGIDKVGSWWIMVGPSLMKFSRISSENNADPFLWNNVHSVTASDNWWGSNADPAAYFGGLGRRVIRRGWFLA